MCLMWDKMQVVSRLTPSTEKALLLKNLSLHTVKSIFFKFDPFHPRVESLREFMQAVYGMDIRQTNPNCRLKIQLLQNREKPVFDAELNDGRKLQFYTDNLTLVNIARIFKKYTPPVPPPEPAATKK